MTAPGRLREETAETAGETAATVTENPGATGVLKPTMNLREAAAATSATGAVTAAAGAGEVAVTEVAAATVGVEAKTMRVTT